MTLPPEDERCALCNHWARRTLIGGVYMYECPVCGVYRVPEEFCGPLVSFSYDFTRFRIPMFVRPESDRGRLVTLTAESVEKIIELTRDAAPPPTSLNALLLDIVGNGPAEGRESWIFFDGYARLGLRPGGDVWTTIDQLVERGDLEQLDARQICRLVRVTVAGAARVEALRRAGSTGGAFAIPTVFIGSPMLDLAKHRAALIETLRRMQLPFQAAEYFPAAPDASIDVCLGYVRRSQIYVGFLGTRYGPDVPGQDGKSMTHLEYLEARRLGLPCLAFVLDEDTPVSTKYQDTAEAKEKLDNLKAVWTRDHMYDEFSTPDDLALRVVAALFNHIVIRKSSK